MFMYIVTYIY